MRARKGPFVSAVNRAKNVGKIFGFAVDRVGMT
jgi:hypothetical protein